jgi:hypothetical protein
MRRREDPGYRARRRRASHGRAAAALAILAVFAMPARAAKVAPGEPILTAAESARAVVAGVVGARRRLDDKSYAATLSLDRTIAGVASPSQLIAWEEPSAARTPRLADGDRILVALDDLPRTSLWRSRLPAGDALIVAAGGNAFIPAPGTTALDAMAAYLQLPVAKRAGPEGNARLAALLIESDAAIAAAALRRLRTSAATLPDTAIAAVERTLEASERPRELRVAVLRLVAQRRLHAVRPTVERLTAAASDVRVAAIDTLGHLDGGLSDETAAALMDSGDAESRVVGARFAGAALAERRLPELSRRDPDAGVRAAAVAALAATNTSWGLAAAIDALADPAPAVRSEAAQAIARLGAVALPALEEQIALGTAAAPGAIATLALMGPAASGKLADIASSHGDQRLRDLALLALGRVRDEHDP